MIWYMENLIYSGYEPWSFSRFLKMELHLLLEASDVNQEVTDRQTDKHVGIYRSNLKPVKKGKKHKNKIYIRIIQVKKHADSSMCVEV